MATGKTRPCLVTYEADDGAEVDLIVKFRAGCGRKDVALATEAICAMLAGDLGLPIPEPFVVKVSPDFAASIPGDEILLNSGSSERSVLLGGEKGVRCLLHS